MTGSWNDFSKPVMNWLSRVICFACVCVLFLCGLSASAQEDHEWRWKDSTGSTRSGAELRDVLQKNQTFQQSNGKGGAIANLSGADLSGLNLNGVYLSGAMLEGAKLNGTSLQSAILHGVNLRRAELISANLSKADLFEATLSFAKMVQTDLSGATLIGTNADGAIFKLAILRDASLAGASLMNSNFDNADLDRAYLGGANLRQCFLGQANLSRANLSGAELAGARLEGADLFEALFEPKSQPDIRGAALARDLEFMTYNENPDALVQLRNGFKENGFRKQERKITYALRRTEANFFWRTCRKSLALADCLAYGFNRFFFDLTCEYGMSPGRALRIWLALLLFCWLVYAVFIHLSGESGIYRLQKIGGPSAKEEIEEQIRPRMISSRPLWRYPLRLIHQELRVFFWAGFFSLMSAFNIGFRDINFGRWLRLLPRTEYDLKAKGWARTVAGFQSLISVYLIALWSLTYFGRPFD